MYSKDEKKAVGFSIRAYVDTTVFKTPDYIKCKTTGLIGLTTAARVLQNVK